ncbi:DUF4149 domain-containing protein [Neisseria perflava]|uniref:DUF4149 domain-containing protein n=1 Tax=Neisseria perflava TaxID=33053 RepID=UPI0020A11D79|nr:DUF4149 domain-containing protein [Neisseria perflava]MCP1660227.1 hypothetical protein [Neisseria perflava]MCP1771837.1 hypothetical protein [Neisseria perflava]
MNRIAAALAAFWLGLQVMAGYIAAPVLFQMLPKLQAGAIAGKLFDVVSYVGLAVWLLVYVVGKREAAQRAAGSLNGKLTAAIIILLAISQFLITPVIEAIKTQMTNWLLSLVGGSFGMWHGISSLIYLLCAIFAVVMVWRIVRWEWR